VAYLEKNPGVKTYRERGIVTTETSRKRQQGRSHNYCYSSCCCYSRSWWDDLFKKPKAPSFQIGSGWNLQRCSSGKYASTDESDFRFDVTFSRRLPRRHFTQQSAATWWVNTKRLPAPMQQRPSVPDL